MYVGKILSVLTVILLQENNHINKSATIVSYSLLNELKNL
jgi:hypothetical protein